MTTVAAIDCGATSLRVCRIELDAGPLIPEVVHRVAHTPRPDASGHLRWDWNTLLSGVIEGLERCLEAGPLSCIGVDTWAVDYGLLDDDEQLIGDPYSYRDHRTDGFMELVDEYGAEKMYRVNGLQLQPFNTIFQLAVHAPDEMAQADQLLWFPELIVHSLTGVAVNERTSAGSSGLVDVSTGDWSSDLLELAGVEHELLGPIENAGQIIGEWRDVPVSLVGGHDTASAVVGMGRRAPGGTAFAASGTWMLAGVERPDADTSDWSRQRNYTNEAGALGGIRFLRNITGFWILEQCRTEWGITDLGSLIAAAEDVGSRAPLVDVNDERLRAPQSMLRQYTALAGLPFDSDPGFVTRSIIESIATCTAAVFDELAQVRCFDDIVLFGGAARMQLLVHRLAEMTGRDVRVGSAEAAALGNAVVQGIAIGTFASLDDASAQLN